MQMHRPAVRLLICPVFVCRLVMERLIIMVVMAAIITRAVMVAIIMKSQSGKSKRKFV